MTVQPSSRGRLDRAAAPGGGRVVGLWRMSRPDQTLLVAMVYAAGVTAAIAVDDGPPGDGVAWGLVALIPAAVSIHLINEYADRATDAITTRTRYSGGSGALSDLGLRPPLPRRAAVVSAGVSLLAAGAGLALGHLPPTAALLLAIGLVGGWQYSIPPLALSRHGWGEVTNALLGGLLLPLYGIAAAAGRITTDDLVMFLPFALVVFVNLLETQWADRHADMATGKNTLAARAPATLLRGLAAAATVAAYTLLLLLAPAPVPPLVAGTSMAALPLSVYAAWQLTRHDTPGPAVLAMLVLLAVQLLSWTHLAC